MVIHHSIAKARRTGAFAFFFALMGTAPLATPAVAQGFCDLVPAATVKSALGLTEKLAAKPKGDGNTGCLYKGNTPGPITLVAEASDASGMRGTMFEQRLTSLGPNTQLVQGLGEAA